MSEKICSHNMKLIDAWVSVDDDTARDVWTEFVIAHQIGGDKFPFDIKNYKETHSFSILKIDDADGVPVITCKDNTFNYPRHEAGGLSTDLVVLD